MNSLDLLTFARGPALTAALVICIFGILLRLFEIYGLGRKTDLAPGRTDSPGSGWKTMLTRSIPPQGMIQRDPVTYIAGYVFHLGLLFALFFFAPHIELIRDTIGLGIGWPALPSPVINALTVASILALFVLLAHRLVNPVKKHISTPGDYLAWTLTLLPLLTGYLAYNHLFLEYTLMLAIHILSAEALLILLPFTKLFHTISVFISRWYNGDMFGRRGVAS
jgi:nitrate reductase gamma subunit